MHAFTYHFGPEPIAKHIICRATTVVNVRRGTAELVAFDWIHKLDFCAGAIGSSQESFGLVSSQAVLSEVNVNLLRRLMVRAAIVWLSRAPTRVGPWSKAASPSRDNVGLRKELEEIG
jgi:hypothetical protein